MPVEFIPKLQWFISLLPNQQRFLQMGEQLRWFPEHFQVRYDEWVNGLKWDWCISRQRFYGVPIPVWYCEGCGAVMLANEHELPVDPTATEPSTAVCAQCGSQAFRAEHDVFDTWMTSSLTPMLNAGYHLVDGTWQAARPNIYPMSLRVQAFEIIRTWLFYTMVKAEYHTGRLPWQDAMISGWGLDIKGKKISKRSGNYQDPVEIVERYSADSLRYWCAQGSLGQDLRYNEEEVKKGRRLQTKLFNATKLLAGVTGGEYRFTGLKAKRLLPVDRWLLVEFNQMLTECTKRFQSYDYANALRGIEGFFWATLCDNGLEMMKTRLRATESEDTVYSHEEGSTGQDVTFAVLLACVQLFAPYLPFITEHIYQGYFRCALGEGAPVSIHITQWPTSLLPGLDECEIADGRNALAVIHLLRKAKTDRQLHIGAPVTEAVIHASKEYLSSLTHFSREIASATRADRVIFREADVLTVDIN